MTDIFIPRILMLFLITAVISQPLRAQDYNPGYTIGTVTGKYNFSYNQTPDQLVELRTPGIISVAFTYQWQSCSTPDPLESEWVTVSTANSYTFSQPLQQTTYFRCRAQGLGATGVAISNTIKISVVSTGWEDINYIRQHNVMTTGMTDWKAIDQLPTGQKLQSTSYLDGLGRSVESVAKEMATPSTSNGAWGDIVSFAQYDALGRQSIKHLPYTTNTEAGKYKTAPLTEQPQYYLNTYNETAAFSSLTFDNSPLNRVKNVKEPGTAWSASAGNSANYDINTSDENVQVFQVDYVQGNPPINKGAYNERTLYKLTYTDVNGKKVIEYSDVSGKLILKKIQLSDAPSVAHAGWICTYSIYDDFGLLRYQIQPEGVNYLDTHGWSFAGTDGQTVLNEQCFQYNYDDKGRTIWKKAPGAAPLKMLYDSRDRVVFTQDGNQAALSTPQWTANLYDDLDRPVITTLYNTSATLAALSADITGAQQSQFTTQTQPQPISNLTINTRDISINRYAATTLIEFTANFESQPGDEFVAEIDPNAATPGQTITTSVQSPVSSANLSNPAVCTILKYLFYDDYGFAKAQTFDNNFINTQAYSNSDPNVIPIATSKRTINKPTGSLTRVLGTTNFLGATIYYDEKGRPIQTLEENIKAGIDITTNQYHFDGRVLSTTMDHSAPGTGYSHFKTLTKYEFDKIGRVKTVNKQFGTNPMMPIADYSFDDIGRLKNKNYDPTYRWYLGYEGGIESLDYSYNIHNQITGINKDWALKNGLGISHYFGMYLGFDNRDNVFSSGQLNGQVAGQLWSTSDNVQRKYEYSYDNAGRLINADYKEQLHPGDGWNNAKMDFSVSGSNGHITYDLNGNLLTMLQKGVMPGTAAPVIIDDLHYTYATLSNKLQSVTDQMLTPTQNGVNGDFKDGANAAGTPDYVYDNDGNLVIDLNKNVKELDNVANGKGISYNFLDKPEQIRIAGKGVIKIVYSADGEKLQRTYTPEAGGNSTTTSYVNGFVYQSVNNGAATLSYFNFEEGRVRIINPVAKQVTNPVSYETTNYDYLYVYGDLELPNFTEGALDYFVRDHQENVRVILTDEHHLASNTCTMETSRGSVETPVFGQTGAANEVDATRYPTPTGWQSTNATGSVSRLGNLSGHNIGPNVLQKVMAGDQVAAKTVYYYDSYSGGSSPNFVSNLLSSLAQALGGGAASGAIHNSVSDITNQLNASPAFLNAVQPGGGSGTTPKAYLTILFFDDQFNLIPQADGGVYQVPVDGSANGTGSPIIRTAVARRNGYVYAYVSNQSDQPVYFDDFQVSIERGALLEENQYYAYGLKIAALSSHAMPDQGEGAVKNNYLYNDKELFDDGDLNWYDYPLRNYDAQIGRWIQNDPFDEFASGYIGIGDDPTNNTDPSGGCVYCETADKALTLSNVTVTAVRHSATHVAQVSTLAKVGSFSLGVVKGLWSGAKGLVTFATEDAWKKSTWINTANLIGTLAIMNGSNGNLYVANAQMSWVDSKIGSNLSGTLDNLTDASDKFVKAAPTMTPGQWGNVTGQVIFAVVGTKGLGAVKNVAKIARFAKTAAVVEDAVSAEGVLVKEGLIENATSNAVKPALTNSQLVQKSATLAEEAIGGKGGTAGTLKHQYASKLINRYQSIYGDRGLETGLYFNRGINNRGFLDVIDHTNGIIYDFKFGKATMSSSQFNKYFRNFGLPIQIIRP